jgi:hypothetical protein
MEATRDPIEEAERAGFDLSLVDSNLRLSVEERLLRHDAALELVLELRAAGAAIYAPITPPAPAAG